jgi:hypothetical protein
MMNHPGPVRADPPKPPLPVSLYFTAEWWDRYYHAAEPRPEKPSDAALEAIYLGRQRFLSERFGAWGVGSERPDLEGGQIATVIRYGFDLVPVLLGTRLDFADAWGFFPRFRTLEEVRALGAVDIAGTAEAEYLAASRDRLVARYGSASHCIDMGSVTNNAFRIIGQEVYTEALADPEGLSALFEVILETERALHRFLTALFGPQDPVPVSNCNVSLFGPDTYERLALPFDVRQGSFAAELSGVPARATLHHCDVPSDPFLGAYSKFPGLVSLQASIASDVAAARATIPGAAFSALVSPSLLNGDLVPLETLSRRAATAGASDLAVWNIDVSTTPDTMLEALAVFGRCAAEAGREISVSAMPLCWEELEWAHGRYQR